MKQSSFSRWKLEDSVRTRCLVPFQFTSKHLNAERRLLSINKKISVRTLGSLVLVGCTIINKTRRTEAQTDLINQSTCVLVSHFLSVLIYFKTEEIVPFKWKTYFTNYYCWWGRSVFSLIRVVTLIPPISQYDSNLVDPASSHMLVLKIKPCMSKYK